MFLYQDLISSFSYKCFCIKILFKFLLKMFLKLLKLFKVFLSFWQVTNYSQASEMMKQSASRHLSNENRKSLSDSSDDETSSGKPKLDETSSGKSKPDETSSGKPKPKSRSKQKIDVYKKEELEEEDGMASQLENLAKSHSQVKQS